MASSNVIEVDVVSKYDSKGTDNAKKATKEYGDGLEKAGEQAGASETRIIGVHDVIDGTATIMQGPGQQGMVSYIQGWADLAGGVEGVLPLLKAMSLAAIKNGAAQVVAAAKTVAAWLAMKATAVASAVQMGIAWAISLGPIALVIGGLALLGIAFIALWKKSQQFRDIVTGVWAVVTAPVQWLVTVVQRLVDAFAHIVSWGAKVVTALGHIAGGFLVVIGPVKSAVGWIERFLSDSIATVSMGNAVIKAVHNASAGGGGSGRAGAAFAAGGITSGGGFWAGEHGREWVEAAAGTRVRSAADSRGGGGTAVVQLEVNVTGGNSGIVRAIRDSIQASVRTQYGGSVQRWAGLT